MANSQVVPNGNQNFRTICKYDTEFCADSVEWCPHKPFSKYFVCGNYQLSEQHEGQPRTRLGRILLFSFTPDDGLILHQTLNTAAVLDQKWCLTLLHGVVLLGVANAQGTLEIYKLTEETTLLELVTSCTVENSKGELLLLSLDWSTKKCNSSDPAIICSDSVGNVHLFKFFSDCNKLHLESTFHGHLYEAWIATFYDWDTNIIFSGGDDNMLLKYDTRISNVPVLRNKLHEAGVTCIQSNAQCEFQLATGSYDESLRIWDIRHMKSVLFTLKMPGPLWRLKWNPHDYKHLLSACMMGGAHIVHVQKNDTNIVQSYYEHKDICYGADWSHIRQDNSCTTATCSFYDHLLCISEVVL